jgi:hypothetical protein
MLLLLQPLPVVLLSRCRHVPDPLPAAAAGQLSKLLVRGDSRAAYHNHVLQAAAAELRAVAPQARLHLETLGEWWGQSSAQSGGSGVHARRCCSDSSSGRSGCSPQG